MRFQRFSAELFRETYTPPLGFSNEVTMEVKFLVPMDHYARNSRLLESIRSPAYLEYKKVAKKIYKREPVTVTDLEKTMKAIP